MSDELTPRQYEVLLALANFGDYRQAALELGMSLQTYKNHISNAYRRLGVESNIDAFRELGWLRVPA